MKKNSWHWRLASYYGPLYNRGYEQKYNICNYTQAVLKGLGVVVFVIIAGGGVMSLMVGDMLAWLAVMYVTGMWISPTTAAGVGAAVVTAVILVALIYSVIDMWCEWNEARREKLYGQPDYNKYVEPEVIVPKEPGFLVLWYRSVKDKYCTEITVE